jgi:DNA-binding MarR family transcriptional regulator
MLLALGSEAALDGGALGVTRIAALTGYEKSQVSRTLRILTGYGLAERSPGTRAFRLGWACFTLAARAGERRLIENGRLALEQLVQEVGEAVHLSALHGAEVLTLLTHPTSHAVAARSWVGRKMPAYCTSSGRALLFDHGPDALLELFGPEPFPPQGPNAPADVGELERRIRGPGCVATPPPTRNPSRAWWPRRRRSATSAAAWSLRSTSQHPSSASAPGLIRPASWSAPRPGASQKDSVPPAARTPPDGSVRMRSIFNNAQPRRGARPSPAAPRVRALR